MKRTKVSATLLIPVVVLLLIPLSPSVGLSRYYHDPGYGHHRVHQHYYDHYDDEVLFWGLGGLFLGTILVAAALQSR